VIWLQKTIQLQKLFNRVPGERNPMRGKEWVGQPLLSLRNHHVEECGKSPHIVDKTSQYVGDFANEYGEQTIFICARCCATGVLYMGDYGWGHPLEVTKGAVPGLVLSEDEATWLRLCWTAATGQRLQPTLMRTVFDLLREAQSTNPEVVAKLNAKNDALRL